MSCPNVNTKEWKELVNAIGEAKAYYVWNANNGNSPKLDSEGKPSELYNKIYKYISGGYEGIVSKSELEAEAIKMKSDMYNYDFMEEYPYEKEPTFNMVLEYDRKYARGVDKGSLRTNVNRLKQVFKDRGIDIKVIEDHTIEGTGVVYKDDKGNIVMKYNPRRATLDTIYHEFGHILIDSIGYNSDFIQQGVKQIRDTELYKLIKERKPGLDNETLDKEVLSTIIGLEGEQLSKDESKIKGIKLWINLFINRIREFFGLKSIDIARDLTMKLVNGNLGTKVRHDFELLEQHQSDLININKYRGLQKVVKTMLADMNSLVKLFEDTTTSKKSIEEALTRINLMKPAVDVANLILGDDSKVKVEFVSSILAERAATELYEALLERYVYDMNHIVTLENKINDLYDKYINKNVSLSELSDNERTVFTNTLYGVLQFTGTDKVSGMFTKVDTQLGTGKITEDNLTDTEKKINELIDNYREDLQDGANLRVTKLRDKALMFMTMAAQYMLDTSSEGIKEDATLYMEQMPKLSFVNMWFDSLADSHNKLGSLAKKLYNKVLFKAKQAAYTKEKEYISKLNDIAPSKSDKKKLSKKLIKKARWITKYDINGFWKVYKETITDTKPPNHKEIGMSAREFNDLKASYNERRKKFIKDNIADNPNQNIIIDTIAKKKEELSDIEFIIWYNKNIYDKVTTIDGSVIYYVKYGSELRPLNNKWLNEEYSNLNEKEREFLDYTLELIHSSSNNYSGGILGEGLIPAVRKNNVLNLNEDVYDIESETSTDVLGENIFKIPFWTTYKLSQKPSIKIRDRMKYENDYDYNKNVISEINTIHKKQFTKLSEVRDYNDKIYTENERVHEASVSEDLEVIIPNFIKAAYNYKVLQDVEMMLKVNIANVRRSRFVESSGMFNTIPTKLRKLIPFKKRGTQEDKGLADRIAMDMKMNFYGRFTKNAKNKFVKTVKIFKIYTVLKGMAYNAFSPVKNLVVSKIQMAISGYFSKEATKFALKTYTKGILSYIADSRNVNTKSGSTYQSALIKLTDIMERQTELDSSRAERKLSAKYVGHLVVEVGMLGQETTEHMVQNEAIFAMMYDYRVVNGKILNLESFINPKLRFEDETLKNTKENIDYNKKITKELEVVFKEYPRLLDETKNGELYGIYKYNKETGYLSFDKSWGVTEDEMFDFIQKMIRNNQNMFGVYNKSDRAMLEHWVLGQAAMTFRHWARQGWNRRFGEYKDNYYNERAGEIEPGDYRVWFKTFTKPFTVEMRDYIKQEIANKKGSNEEQIAINAAMLILKGYQDMIANAKLYRGNLKPHEIKALKRASKEMIVLLMSMLLYGMMHWRDDEDKDKERSFMYNYVSYVLDGIITELNTFMPTGWYNEGKKIFQSPFAGLQVLDQSVLLFKDMYNIPFGSSDDMKFQTGKYHNMYKLPIHLIKMLPFATQIERLIMLDKNQKYYRLFRPM